MDEEGLEQVTAEPEEPQETEEEEDEVEKALQLRRSARIRRPVERYGLQYQCRTAELDQGQVERANAVIYTLLKQPTSAEVVGLVERALWGIVNLG